MYCYYSNSVVTTYPNKLYNSMYYYSDDIVVKYPNYYSFNYPIINIPNYYYKKYNIINIPNNIVNIYQDNTIYYI